jgi:hypothetical protein
MRPRQKGLVGVRWGRPELVAHGAARGGEIPTRRKNETSHDGPNDVIIDSPANDGFHRPVNSKRGYIMIDTINTFKTVSAAIYNGVNALETINEQAKALKAGGIVFGKSVKSCQYRVQFKDAMKAVFKGKAEKTYSNYMTGFVSAVNDGVPFSFSSSKGKSKAKGKGTEKDESIFPLLAKLFGHADFKVTTMAMQMRYEDDEGDISDIVQSMLEAEGYEIKE